jgi:transposase
VESVTRELIEAKKSAAAQLRGEAEAFVAARGPEAAVWVREFREVHGHGPLWSELAQALQLDYLQRDTTILGIRTRRLDHDRPRDPIDATRAARTPRSVTGSDAQVRASVRAARGSSTAFRSPGSADRW